MSKEIYKEYVNKWIDADDRLKKCEINSMYLYRGQPIRANGQEDLFAIGYGYDFERVTRKPKTQIINGHEVVAPCYEPAENNELIYVFYPFEERGVKGVTYTPNMIFACRNFGFFYDRDDAIAYANAHRENKSD